jgi:Family of unknown function (DUF6159)
MDRFSNSIALAKSSWRVLRDDKQLAILPVLSSVATIVVMLTFLVPIALVSHDASSGGGWTAKPIDLVLGFLGYFAVTYVVVFFNAALVYAADRRLQGQNVTLGEAINAAKERAHILLPWALLSATVSLALRAVEQRGGIIAQIVASIAGLAWSLVTFLVLPVLVIEGVGVGDAVRRSTDLFKRTWGENMIANAGIGLLAFLAVIAGALPLFLFLAVGGPIAVLGIVLFVAWVVAVSLVSATLTGILQVALYRFATQGSVPGFSNDELNGVFRPRRNRGSTFGF